MDVPPAREIDIRPAITAVAAGFELQTAVRCLSHQELGEGRLRLKVDTAVYLPDADPVALISQAGLGEGPDHLILWRGAVWSSREWRLLLFEALFAGFGRFAIPLMKRVYPPLIASQIVSVQPMKQPAGLIHYLQYKYSQGATPVSQQETTPYRIQLPSSLIISDPSA